MRRKEKEIKNIDEILEILDKSKICRVGFNDDEGIYIIPLNFGYEYVNSTLTLYFHGAKSGRKAEIIKTSPLAGFEIDIFEEILSHELACEYSCKASSIIGNGKAIELKETSEKSKALEIIMKHQTGKNFEITEKMAESVLVFKIEAKSFTAKRI